jgi:hypothetical protein
MLVCCLLISQAVPVVLENEWRSDAEKAAFSGNYCVLVEEIVERWLCSFHTLMYCSKYATVVIK